eukprot:6102183-Pyramimonas_sp.AAC.1
MLAERGEACDERRDHRGQQRGHREDLAVAAGGARRARVRCAAQQPRVVRADGLFGVPARRGQ